ncbi:response regulator transcription factor [Gemmatimonas sp.]|uniref:response regulator transcription factor n=1 Tax=Gemmatimonas sp. TaxID=1962908 RepID=UPI0035640745
MTERPRAVRVFVDVSDPWKRRVLRDALGAHADVRFVATASAADVRVVETNDRTDATPSTLSDREREVLQALSEGLSNAAIGVRLGISRSTVKFHLAAVFEKLGVHRRAEAVAAGIRRGDVLL